LDWIQKWGIWRQEEYLISPIVDATLDHLTFVNGSIIKHEDFKFQLARIKHVKYLLDKFQEVATSCAFFLGRSSLLPFVVYLLIPACVVPMQLHRP
jgi:hypothetical protein